MVRRFHELLTDSALKYFRSIKCPGLDYFQLKSAFFRTFDVTNYEFKIERELRGLKQQAYQSIRDFKIQARDLNSKLSSPIDEESLLLVVKYGMHPRFYPCLATNLFSDLDSLLRVAGNFEAFQGHPRPALSVAPVQTDSPTRCLKCDRDDHQYRACPKYPEPVCFRCKRLGVVTRDCTACNPPVQEN